MLFQKNNYYAEMNGIMEYVEECQRIDFHNHFPNERYYGVC